MFECECKNALNDDDGRSEPSSGSVARVPGEVLRYAAVRVAIGAARRGFIEWGDVDDVAHDGVCDYLKQRTIGKCLDVDPVAAVVQATRFRILKRLRSKKRQAKTYELVAASSTEAHEMDADALHILARLESRLIEIIQNDDVRMTFILREFRLMSEEDIGREMHVPLGTVKSRLHRAKKYIQDWLGLEAKILKSST